MRLLACGKPANDTLSHPSRFRLYTPFAFKPLSPLPPFRLYTPFAFTPPSLLSSRRFEQTIHDLGK